MRVPAYLMTARLLDRCEAMSSTLNPPAVTAGGPIALCDSHEAARSAVDEIGDYVPSDGSLRAPSRVVPLPLLGRDDVSDSDIALNEPHLALRDGTQVLIRRLVAEDAALYPDFLSDVTAEDLRLRFFASMRGVSDELLDKLIHYDPARAMAFIVVEGQGRRMLGVVRLHDDTSGENAEFAILVRSRFKGHGVGWLLMKHMIEFSKHKNLKTVRGQVLSENATMLAMCAELGFQIADDPDDPGVKTVTLAVRTALLI
jgi:RimJ/RimL family protein N-acetyltransferase